MKLFRIGWTDEGIMWRRKYYVILKPRHDGDTWKVRKVKSAPGKQLLEFEQDFVNEAAAFRFGKKANKVFTKELREQKKNETI